MLNLRPRVVVCEYLMKICQNRNRESGKQNYEDLEKGSKIFTNLHNDNLCKIYHI